MLNFVDAGKIYCEQNSQDVDYLEASMALHIDSLFPPLLLHLVLFSLWSFCIYTGTLFILELCFLFFNLQLSSAKVLIENLCSKYIA